MSEFSVKINGVQHPIPPHEVRELFESGGYQSVTDVFFPPNKNFGFVRFSSEEEAYAAADMKFLIMHGVQMGLEMSQGKKQKGGGGGMGGMMGMNMLGGKGGKMMGMMGMYGGGGGGKGHGKKIHGQGEHSVWVGNVPESLTKDELHQMFVSCGVDNMSDVYVPEGKGFAFVRFKTLDEVDNAIRMCQGLQYQGQELQIKSSSQQPGNFKGTGKVGEHSIWVGNLPAGATSEDLKMCFQEYGVYSFTDVYCPGGEKTFGFVRFSSAEEVDRAMKICRGLQMAGQALEMKSSITEKNGNPNNDFMQGGMWGKGGFGGMGGMGGMEGKKVHGQGEHSLWVGGLSSTVSKHDLELAFKERGVDTMTDTYIPPGKDFGFIRFAAKYELENAMALCAGMTLQGTELQLKESEPGRRSGDKGGKGGGGYGGMDSWGMGGMGCMGGMGGKGGGVSHVGGKAKVEVSVKVSPLANGTSVEELKAAFEAAGVDTMSDVYIPPGRNFGFLRFQSLSEIKAVLQLSGQVWVGMSQVAIEQSDGGKKGSQDMMGGNGGKGDMAMMMNMMGGFGPAKGNKGCGFGPFGGKGQRGW